MIFSKDRSYYIGASDTSYVVGNWETASFAKWYGTKLGIYESNFTNDSMLAGTAYEHRILESLKIKNLEMDKQIIKGRLRVNLDGNTKEEIYEVKTHNNNKKFVVSKSYRNQVNVEMYAFDIRKAKIVSYALNEEDYKNFYNDIDDERICFYKIEYDKEFIDSIYIPRFCYLSICLEKGRFPNIEEFNKWKSQERFLISRRIIKQINSASLLKSTKLPQLSPSTTS